MKSRILAAIKNSNADLDGDIITYDGKVYYVNFNNSEVVDLEDLNKANIIKYLDGN